MKKVLFGLFCVLALFVLVNVSAGANDVPPVTLPGTMEKISVSTTGIQGDDDSSGAMISADGRTVVFYSYAGNLVANDTNDF
ncbi:MAG: hypothetical protein GY796_26940 [Chloroflexi bacterium]|nr:hypothetical protein [Chloroflexota bacterium]